MANRKNRERFNWFLLMIGYFTAGYLFINKISSGRDHFFNVETGFDEAVPFIPAFIFGYILVYLSVIMVYVAIRDMGDWYRAAVSFLLATTLAYIVFLLFPVRMLRPDILAVHGLSAAVTRFYFFIDLPFNCFPSLHVTYPTLATLVSWRNHKNMRWIFAAMTVIVAVSVVLVKQHYVADVIAGFSNAVLCFWLTVKLESRWSKWPVFNCQSPSI